MEKRSFHLFCLQELLNNKHIRQNRVRILQSQCTGPTALVPPAAPEPPLLHACLTGKHMGPCPMHSSSSGKLTYPWANSQLIWDEKHSPCLTIIYWFLFWCNKPWKKTSSKRKGMLNCCPKLTFFSWSSLQHDSVSRCHIPGAIFQLLLCLLRTCICKTSSDYSNTLNSK